jgi:ornithine cyclodeaminase/alanine dehydrogenase-like protein (mu-crystallin family)
VNILLILTASQVREALPISDAIQVMAPAFQAFSNGTAIVPPRTRIDIPGCDSHALFMPAYIAGNARILVVKAVQVYSHNRNKGLPVVNAAVLLMDGRTGIPLASMEGSSLTAIRTGAASGLATDLLARRDSECLSVIGAGVQARTQLEAVCAVRNIRKIVIFDPTPSKARTLITEMTGKTNIPDDMTMAENARAAVLDADIICTATTSKNPVFDDYDVSGGVHINAIGSYLPSMQEIPAETICRAKIIVDSRNAVLTETGDVIIPVERGIIQKDHIHAELGEIVAGVKAGRMDDSEITLFKSVGLAVQDAAAAFAAYKNACARDIGHRIDWLL